jgi:hypothetical protein
LFIEDEELSRGEIMNLFFQQIQYCGTGSKHSNPFSALVRYSNYARLINKTKKKEGLGFLKIIFKQLPE